MIDWCAAFGLVGIACATYLWWRAASHQANAEYWQEQSNIWTERYHEACEESLDRACQLQRAKARYLRLAEVIDNIEAALEGVPIEEQT